MYLYIYLMDTNDDKCCSGVSQFLSRFYGQCIYLESNTFLGFLLRVIVAIVLGDTE